MALKADAQPTKRFFIDNLTRDLSLEDAILDLVDNAIDAYIRIRELDVSGNMLTALSNPDLRDTSPEKAAIKVSLEKTHFEISDEAGGIDLEHARKKVFRMGRVDADRETTLGVYGIGLKRAIFKIGNKIEIESHTISNGFRLSLNVKKWASNEKPNSWTFPLVRLNKARNAKTAGTRIRIEELSPSVQLRLKDPKLLNRLREHISKTYTLFLDKFLTISLNGVMVDPTPFPIGVSEEVSPGIRNIQLDGVTVNLLTGLAQRKRGEWSNEGAGWYVLCNGRVVVSADKTELTGWGIHGPQYVSKYRGFIGIAFFFADNPASLPWTTTKRGLNLDSEVYQEARSEMTTVARPVLSFLNKMYPSEAAEEISERRLADDLQKTDVGTVIRTAPDAFRIPPARKAKKKTTVKVAYKAEIADVKRIQKRINKPAWSAGAVGRYTFDYFLEMEIAE